MGKAINLILNVGSITVKVGETHVGVNRIYKHLTLLPLTAEIHLIFDVTEKYGIIMVSCLDPIESTYQNL